MHSLIHKIRGKSKATRRFAALSISLGITGIFAFFWALSYADYSDKILNSKDNGSASKAMAIWDEMSAKIGKSYDNFSKTTSSFGGIFGQPAQHNQGVQDSQSQQGSSTDELAGSTASSSSDIKIEDDKATTSGQDLVQ